MALRAALVEEPAPPRLLFGKVQLSIRLRRRRPGVTSRDEQSRENWGDSNPQFSQRTPPIPDYKMPRDCLIWTGTNGHSGKARVRETFSEGRRACPCGP